MLVLKWALAVALVDSLSVLLYSIFDCLIVKYTSLTSSYDLVKGCVLCGLWQLVAVAVDVDMLVDWSHLRLFFGKVARGASFKLERNLALFTQSDGVFAYLA